MGRHSAGASAHRPTCIAAPDSAFVTTIRDLGEFGLIQHLEAMVSRARLEPPQHIGFRLHRGIGDDAAAWYTGEGIVVQTTDSLVEGVHYTVESVPWRDVGWKTIVASLSDVAAMGGTPLVALITLGLPPNMHLGDVEELYAGLLEACRRYRLLLVGGDIVSSPIRLVTATVTGSCPAEPMLRTAARPGDAIGVTGPLGASAGGLRLLNVASLCQADQHAQALVHAHRRPEPRLDAGRHLLRSGIRCAMDISDGLVADLGKLGSASGVGARVDSTRIPLPDSLGRRFPEISLELALSGGEDYELLFTGPPAPVRRLVAELPGATIIGEMTADVPGTVRVVNADGSEHTPARAGWDHLRR